MSISVIFQNRFCGKTKIPFTEWRKLIKRDFQSLSSQDKWIVLPEIPFHGALEVIDEMLEITYNSIEGF